MVRIIQKILNLIIEKINLITRKKIHMKKKMSSTTIVMRRKIEETRIILTMTMSITMTLLSLWIDGNYQRVNLALP